MRMVSTVALGLLALVAGCGSSSSGHSAAAANPRTDKDAAAMADEDGSSDGAAYSAALDNLTSLCTQPRSKVASFVRFAHSDLAKYHIQESDLSVMAHLAASIPSSVAPTDCQGIAAAYLVLREPK